MILRHVLEFLIVCAVLAGGAVLPRRALLAAGRGIGSLWYRLDSTRRILALRNLESALGDRTKASERRELARESFRLLGQSAADLLTLHRWKDADFRRRVRVEGLERIRSAYSEGKGVLLFSGHFGCWELVPIVQAREGLRLALVVRPLDNPLLDRLLSRLRTRAGNRLIRKRSAVREILRTLKGGGCAAIVMDQNVRAKERVFVRFFGMPASAVPTVGVMAVRTGAAVIPVFCVPEPGGRYTIRYEQGIHVERTGDRERDAWEIVQRATASIEEYVRSFPEAWLWMHDRFRSRPRPDEKGPEHWERLAGPALPREREPLPRVYNPVVLGPHGKVRTRG